MPRPRKPEGEARTDVLRIRLTPAERERIEKAVPPGLETSTWARSELLKLAATLPKKKSR